MVFTECRVRIRLRCWVRPYIALARFNASLGIPVDLDRLTETILKHGVSYKLA